MVNDKVKRILFLEGNPDGTIGGSYYLMYDLVRHLDKEKYYPIVGFHTDNILVPKLREFGIETYVIKKRKPFKFEAGFLNQVLLPFKKLINVFTGLILPALDYARFLKEHRIDLINLNNSIVRNHAWMLAAKLTGIKCMTHEMGINKKYSFISRFLGKRLDAIVSLSYAISDAMKVCGIEYPNISVIHCGIDLERYKIERSKEELRTEYKIPKDAPIIGVVGNVKLWKGQETIVRAMQLLKQKYNNLRCILVGDTSEVDRGYKDMLIRLCEEMDIRENVIFAGFQRNVIDFMNLMDIVVHTSIEPEPFGIVTLEAMNCKKPLVSTTIGGPAEVVINGETGLLVQPGEPGALFEAVDSLLSDKEKAERFAQAGYERLQNNFTLEKNIKETMQVYDKIFQ